MESAKAPRLPQKFLSTFDPNLDFQQNIIDDENKTNKLFEIDTEMSVFTSTFESKNGRVYIAEYRSSVLSGAATKSLSIFVDENGSPRRWTVSCNLII